MHNNDNTQKEIVQTQYDMMKDRKYTDFTVITNDDFRFDVHRLCLSRCPYFAIIFDNQTIKMNKVDEIREDIDKDTFEIILQFVYTGEAQIIDDCADKLIECAFRYGMKELVELYSPSLLKTLSVDTAAYYLTLAGTVPGEALKWEIISFIGKNLSAVMRSDGWPKAAENFELMSELIEQMLIEKRHVDIGYGTITTAMDGPNFDVTWTLRMEIDERLRVQKLDPAKYSNPIEFSSSEFFLRLNGKQTSWKLITLPYFIEQEQPFNLYGFKAVIIYLAYTGSFEPPQIVCKWEVEKPEGCGGKRNGSVKVVWEAVENWYEEVTPIDLTGMIFVGDKIVLRVNFSCSKDHGHLGQLSKEELAEQVLARALKRRKNCDAKVIVGDYKFDVHKFVLSEQSQVFDDMFDSVQTTYTLDNIRPPVFEALLSLMYVMDDITSDETVNEELLLAAHNYKLSNQLVRRCEEFLMENLLPANAAKFLLQAHLTGAKKLKATALRFIGRSAEAVMASVGWLSLQTKPSLMTDVIEAIFKPEPDNHKMGAVSEPQTPTAGIISELKGKFAFMNAESTEL